MRLRKVNAKARLGVMSDNALIQGDLFISGRASMGSMSLSENLNIFSNSPGGRTGVLAEQGSLDGSAEFRAKNNAGHFIDLGMNATQGAGLLYGIPKANLGLLTTVGADGLMMATDNTAPLIFVTNGSEKMRLTPEGSVGIGTSGPSQKLDVQGFVKGQSGLCIAADCRSQWPVSGITAENDNLQSVTDRGASTSKTLTAGGLETSGALSLGSLSPWTLFNQEGAYNVLRIEAPASNSLIHFRGSSDYLRVDNAQAPGQGVGASLLIGARFNSQSQDNVYAAISGVKENSIDGNTAMSMILSVRDGLPGGEVVRLLSNGNVGIGTQTPSQKLDVAGNALIQGDLFISGKASMGSMSLSENLNIFSNSPGGRTGVLAEQGSLDGSAEFRAKNNAGHFIDLGMNGAQGAGLLYGLYGLPKANLGLLTTVGADGLMMATDNTAPLIFVTNGSEKMRLSPEGKVGIGTSSPSQLFDINGKIVMTSTGSVGIGTTIPTRKLHLEDTGPIELFINRTGPNVSGNGVALHLKGGQGNADWNLLTDRPDIAAADDLIIAKGAGSPGAKLVIQDSGNLGIGTNNPSQKLDVAGNALIQGDLTVSKDLTVTGKTNFATQVVITSITTTNINVTSITVTNINVTSATVSNIHVTSIVVTNQIAASSISVTDRLVVGRGSIKLGPTSGGGADNEIKFTAGKGFLRTETINAVGQALVLADDNAAPVLIGTSIADSLENRKLQLFQSGDVRMFIRSGSSSAAGLELMNSVSDWNLLANSSGKFQITSDLLDNNKFLTLSPQGFLGLGTQSPNQRLDVVGNIALTGSLSTTRGEISAKNVVAAGSVTASHFSGVTLSMVTGQGSSTSETITAGGLVLTGTTSLKNTIISGKLNMNTNKILNLASPTEPSDAATKSYVDSTSTDTLDSVVQRGNTTTKSITVAGLSSNGNVVMNSNKITNLATPTDSSDAATKGYVDAMAGIPPGVIILWLSSSTCPTGFTRETALDGLFLKGADKGAGPGGTGGSATHEHAVSGTTNVPSGTKGVQGCGFGNCASVPDPDHKHNFEGTALPVSNEPPFKTILFCKKE